MQGEKNIQDTMKKTENKIVLDEKLVKSQLRTIIEEKRIKPVYQPIVSLKDGEILGYEALSRIDMPQCLLDIEEMFIYTEQFQSSYLWNLEYICRKKAIKGIKDELGEKKLFINVDPCIFHDERFRVGMTKNYLKRYEISPEQIVFELSERTDIREMGSFQRLVNHYKGQNYEIAIDDFGKGYAGFNRIFFLQPKYVKIDMSIIRNIDKDAVKSSLVSGLVDFCKEDGIRLIAEGVETKEELKKIIQLGVDYAQGYYLGRPKPKLQTLPQEIQKMIQNESLNVTRIKEKPSFFGNVGSICHRIGTTNYDTRAVDVFEYMQNNPEITEMAVIGKEGRVCGLLTKKYLDECFGGRYGYNLYSKKTVEEMIDSNYLEVDSRMPVETVAKLALIRPKNMIYDAIVVSDNGIYDGLVTVKDLLEASITIQVERAMDTNPLTHLPGNLQVQKQIETHLIRKGSFSIMYLDLDHFKAYNDAYGFENGDLMIQAAAKCMKDACRNHEFVGHIGGDDFVIISEGYHLEEVFERVVDAFHLCLRELYTKGDYERKEIHSKNRKGEPEVFPLVSISGALLTNENTEIKSMDDFNEKIALTKKSSKGKTGDTLVKYSEI